MASKEKMMEVLFDSENNKKEEFGDILDALKDGMKVYEQSDYHLDQNFLWCKKPDEKWTTFHTRQHIVAKKIERSFPKIKVIKYNTKGEKGYDPKQEEGTPLYDPEGHYQYEELPNPLAKKAFLLVMMPSNDWAILNRNDIENVIMTGILKWGDSAKELIAPKDTAAPGTGLLPKKITQFFKKKKKEEVIMGE